MYIFQFFLKSANSLADGIYCACCWTSQEGTEEAAAPLLEAPSRERPRSYNSLSENSELGLTATYESWFESKDALPYALGHLFMYMVLAVVGFSFVLEQWPIYNSIYFAVVVFTTVGYGDLSPTNDYSRLFVIFFALYGIVILGIFLGIVGQFILEKNDENRKKRISNARVKVMEQFAPVDNALPPKEHHLFNDIWEICVGEAPIILVLILLGAPIVYLEGWDPVQGLYWMVVTGTTVGFGDLGPTQVATRCICIVWIPLAVAVLGEFLGRIAGTYIDRQNDIVEAKFLQRAMTMADIRRMDTNHDNEVSPNEFLCYMLVALQKVEQHDVDDIMSLFHKLDANNNGVISKEDLIANLNLNVMPGVTVNASNLPTASETS